MNFKYLLLAVFLCSGLISKVAAQTIKGQVLSSDNEPLVGASVQEIDTQNGSVVDVKGEFSFIVSKLPTQLIVSFIGFETDTFNIKDQNLIKIILSESAEQIDEVVIKSSSTFFDPLKPIMNEVITEKELEKAACCNLSESFETNASVDVSFTDALSGGKVIKVLGLDGKYVQINRENLPGVRGLTSRYGLEFIPGTWIQSIDVGKGIGSVTSGFESMSGHINLEFKKPRGPETLYFNTYANSFGRAEINFNKSFQLGEKWSSALLLHTDYLNSTIDRNEDGFLDLPRSRQINFLNRYGYSNDRWITQLGIHLMVDEKSGGQVDFEFGDDLLRSAVYGFRNDTKRAEIFGKTFLTFPSNPFKGWGFIYSLMRQEVDGGFGRTLYNGKETTFFSNLIHQNIIASSFHQYKAGISLMVDDFNEQFQDSLFSRREVIPGIYFEYSYLPGDDFSFVAGARVDNNNLYGTYFSPRAHLKYNVSKNLTSRLSIGKGFRTPNAITEAYQYLISSRRLILEEAPRPEVSWNMGGSLIYNIKSTARQTTLVADYYYTTFENQLVFDRDQSADQLLIYNLDGNSYAHSFQLELDKEISDNVNIKTAYKYYDVKTTIGETLREVPGVSKNRFFLNASYATRFEKWKADATLQWFSQKRLPDTEDNPERFRRPVNSDSYALVNMQISRGFRKGSIYVGVENLFDFRQSDPIIDPENPFGENFDSSLVWGPVAGRVIYAGFRYKIKSKS